MKQDYKEQLKDERWQKKRYEILNRDNFTCQYCGCTFNLNVHHIKYEYNKKAWEYNNNNLITLCKDCHNKIHEKQNINKIDAQIGDVYIFEHSEYINYYIVYDIDYLHKKVKLFGYDNGSGMDSIWFDIFNFNDFKSKCIFQNDFFNDESNNYISNILIEDIKLLKSYRLSHNDINIMSDNENKENIMSAILNIPTIMDKIK